MLHYTVHSISTGHTVHSFELVSWKKNVCLSTAGQKNTILEVLDGKQDARMLAPKVLVYGLFMLQTNESPIRGSLLRPRDMNHVKHVKHDTRVTLL